MRALPLLLSLLLCVAPAAGQEAPTAGPHRSATELVRLTGVPAWVSADLARGYRAQAVSTAWEHGEAGPEPLSWRREGGGGVPEEGEVRQVLARVLAELYTEPELQELIRFYGTEVGRKSLLIGPELTERLYRYLLEAEPNRP